MSQDHFEQARQYVLDRLARELSPLITYHSLTHTLEEVSPAADQFAALEGVTGEDLLLLRTAAVYHDAGFVEQHHAHEEGSARIAAAALPGFGYTPEQIARLSTSSWPPGCRKRRRLCWSRSWPMPISAS